MMIDYPREHQLPGLRRLWKEAFGDSDAFLDRFFSLAFDHQRCLCAWEGDSLTGMLHWLPCTRGEDRLAYIYAVATHPDHRGKGICRDLMTAAHALLREEGYAGALLYPQEEGLREMYRKMGYKTDTYIAESICSPGIHPAPLHAVTAEEYFRLRQEYLPKNSVCQSSPFRELLEPEFRFFKGLGFLLAAQVKEDHLFGAEFLGDPETMPGILCSLGIPYARFRTPGKKIPFAMFCPLVPGTASPDYFGFPLD